MSADNIEQRPLTALELLARVRPLPESIGIKREPKATNLRPVTLESIKEELKTRSSNAEEQVQK